MTPIDQLHWWLNLAPFQADPIAFAVHDALETPEPTLKRWDAVFTEHLGASLQAVSRCHELGQSGGIAAFQAEGGISGMTPLHLVRVVIIRALQLEVTENPLHGDRLPALADLPSLGLIGIVNALDGLLQQPADQGVGRLETGGAHQ